MKKEAPSQPFWICTNKSNTTCILFHRLQLKLTALAVKPNQIKP